MVFDNISLHKIFYNNTVPQIERERGYIKVFNKVFRVFSVFLFFSKKCFAVRFRDKFPAIGCQRFLFIASFDFMNYFVQMFVEKQQFQLWSSIKSAKLDISKIAETLLLEIYLGIELRNICLNKIKRFVLESPLAKPYGVTYKMILLLYLAVTS